MKCNNVFETGDQCKGEMYIDELRYIGDIHFNVFKCVDCGYLEVKRAE